jgi:hypothetical protein
MQTRRFTALLSNNFPILVLISILLFALLVRIFRAHHGLPYLYHWDEPQIASNALQMLKTGSFNPHFFNYGTLTIYINYFADVLHYLYLMGQPDSARSFLNSISEIQTLWDTKWHWTISHPSFYYINRIVGVLFGTATVLVVYLISNNLFKYKWSSFISAIAIAGMGAHVSSSAIISPDIPAAFFISASVLFGLLFLDNKQTKYYVVSLVLVGCAMATKYNSGLVLIMPVAILVLLYIRNRSEFKFAWFGLLATVPFVTFFICMPYALLDSVAFLNGLGGEIRHYKVHGHGTHTSLTSWHNAAFQLKSFEGNVGIFGLLLSLIGALNALRRPKLLLILLLLMVYFYSMIQMKVNFHRNLLWFYPFIAVLYGSACDLIYSIGKSLSIKFSKPILMKAVVLINCGVFVFFSSMAWSEMRSSLVYKARKDSRTLIIDKLDDLNQQKIYLANELRFHNQDIKRLSTPHQKMTLSEIFSCPSKISDGLVVLPSKVWMMGPNEADKKMLKVLTENLDRIDSKNIVLRQGPMGSRTYLDIYSVNPEMLVINGARLANCTN